MADTLKTTTHRGAPANTWAGDVAATCLARDERVRGVQAEQDATRARLAELVGSAAEVWFERVLAAAHEAASAFNARAGDAVITTRQSRNGSISITAAYGYTRIVPALDVEDGHYPGAIVTQEFFDGRSSVGFRLVTPCAFVVDGDRLCLRFTGGDLFGPEGFARAVLEPWLSQVPLGGR